MLWVQSLKQILNFRYVLRVGPFVSWQNSNHNDINTDNVDNDDDDGWWHYDDDDEAMIRMILEQVWREDTLVQLHCRPGLSKACPDNGSRGECTASKWKRRQKIQPKTNEEKDDRIMESLVIWRHRQTIMVREDCIKRNNMMSSLMSWFADVQMKLVRKVLLKVILTKKYRSKNWWSRFKQLLREEERPAENLGGINIKGQQSSSSVGINLRQTWSKFAGRKNLGICYF